MKTTTQAMLFLMSSLKKDYGLENGQEIFDRICNVVPEELNHYIMEFILKTPNSLSEEYTMNFHVTIKILDFDVFYINRVSFVRELREYGDYSLKNAVDIMRNIQFKGQDKVILYIKQDKVTDIDDLFSHFGLKVFF